MPRNDVTYFQILSTLGVPQSACSTMHFKAQVQLPPFHACLHIEQGSKILYLSHQGTSTIETLKCEYHRVGRL